MPNWSCVSGSTLLIPSGPQGHHLFIVLINPTTFDGHPSQSCISVPLCTIPLTPYDLTCIVGVGEHKFIKSPSYIAYRHIRMDAASHLNRMVGDQIGFPQDPISTNLLVRIKSGIHTSKQTPNIFKRLMIE